jgi:ribosomal protein S18 acetylase RimI-like enzyme
MKHAELHWSDGPELHGDLVVEGLAGLAGSGEEMDARVFLTDSAGSPAAWASLWWRATPELDGAQVGAIGGFGAFDPDAAGVLLDACCKRLAEEGCRCAVGPMNGNTWRSYRHVVWSSGRGPFLLETRNPVEYPGWWMAAGFAEIAGYSSSVVPLDGRSTVPDSLAGRLVASGVKVRDLDMADYDAELGVIYDVTLAGFSANFLYTPLAREPFLAAYRRIRERVDPRFVRIAERDGKACGYVFAIADLEAAGRGEKPALIIKTLTVDPAARCAGLGSLLVDEVQRRGHAAGFTEALHVLQYDDNNVLRITRRHGGERFRRYSLFSKPL